MNTDDFNAEAAAPLYTYRKSPVHPRGYMILKLPDDDGEPRPVGDYTVLDQKEEAAQSERKVMNLIALLNGRKHLMQLGHETGTRVLYHIVSDSDDENRQRVLFYTLGANGVSVENALFRLEKDDHATH